MSISTSPDRPPAKVHVALNEPKAKAAHIEDASRDREVTADVCFERESFAATQSRGRRDTSPHFGIELLVLLLLACRLADVPCKHAATQSLRSAAAWHVANVHAANRLFLALRCNFFQCAR